MVEVFCVLTTVLHSCVCLLECVDTSNKYFTGDGMCTASKHGKTLTVSTQQGGTN